MLVGSGTTVLDYGGYVAPDVYSSGVYSCDFDRDGKTMAVWKNVSPPTSTPTTCTAATLAATAKP